MVDIKSRRTNRINEAVKDQAPMAKPNSKNEEPVVKTSEAEPVGEDVYDTSHIVIPKFKQQIRPSARKNDYSDEKTKKTGVELPITVHKAFSVYCSLNDTEKGIVIRDMLMKLLRKENLIK